MDEDGFAGRRVAAFKHIVPHGEQRFRQCRGLRHFHSRWNGQANVGAGDAIFGISAARYQRTLARAQKLAGHARTDRDNNARYFQSGQIARAWRRRI